MEEQNVVLRNAQAIDTACSYICGTYSGSCSSKMPERSTFSTDSKTSKYFHHFPRDVLFCFRLQRKPHNHPETYPGDEDAAF